MSSWTNCAESVHDQEQKRGLVFYGPTKVPRCRPPPPSIAKNLALQIAGYVITACPHNTDSERQRFSVHTFIELAIEMGY